MRVAYFNEVDTFCELVNQRLLMELGLIRIGSKYCNPSFGYGDIACQRY